ncbi:MAG: Cache 3/Cache 2 fusion domain-containing protein [Candidatus Omnitrophica bacterium]|nr:Cache 3/Cache 2 fusion domain-containing protein [Candidatus Omnitrophota bacterium]MDD5775383.1 Cache 3/Cache 2 fusion domain-containing protein [Candidatus Omnitrophota bacterium]
MKGYMKAVAVLAVLGIMAYAGIGCVYAQSEAEKVKTAMKALQDKTTELGSPVNDAGTLMFGEEEMNGNYDLVDEIQDNYGGTATIFAKTGNDFKRISTNVIKDGNRAVGTLLDPNGAAIKKIKAGEAFYGEADILGEKYETGYEPIKDASGEVIGIWYVGYKK